ncbi:MAG: 4-coumarate--CoA ligase family protein [Trueperaceae bacterium]|nr:4-coumarate--CoA ligase family protein [Trueperaceae bacterium]
MIIKSPFPDVEIPELSLTEVVLAHAGQLGDKAALIDGPSGRTISYKQLAGAVQLVASSLSQRGFGRDDVLAIYSPNVPEYAIAFLAVARLGGVVTTINPLYTPHELNHQLKDAGASYLLTIPQFLENAQKGAEDVAIKEFFVFGEAEGATAFASLLKSEGKLPDVAINAKEDTVVLPYSSGTTGLPKGVILTHYNLVANIKQLEGMQNVSSHPISKEDVMLGLLPFYHIYGMVVIMLYGLYKGATVVTMPRFDMEQFLGIVQNYKVSYANLVPPIVLGLAKHPLVDNYDLSSLRTIFSGAAPLGGDVAQACAKRLDCDVCQGYGMTELSPVSHANPDQADIIDYASVGPALPNTECRITDPVTGEDVDVGQPGELWIRGPQRMVGYLNNQTATANTIDSEGWLHTGDIATVDDKGYFAVIDRVKELIKYKGLQVAPAELEAVLLTNPNISDAAVIGRPDEEAGELPKAFVVKKGEITEDEVMAYVAERVAPYKKIRIVEFVEQIPKSSSGKILRRVLVDQERAKSA